MHEHRQGEGTERRAHLDGLRAVAVFLVLLFHTVVAAFRGGSIGVDIFFVLSGYLVTEVLTRDLAAQGSIRLARFYARRVVRLLPAATAALLISGVVYSAVTTQFGVDAAVPGFRAAFLYVMNWYVIDQATQNAGSVALANPALLFWSLAVEEQFYLVWPLLFGGLFSLTRRWSTQFTLLRLVLIAGMLASVAWALALSDENPARAYYGTDARGYQLLAGALLALTPGLVTRLTRFVIAANVVAALALVGVGLVAVSTVFTNPVERGVVATVLAVLLIVSLEAAPRGPVARLLSLGPVVYLGLISYGIYLWQWPVIRVADEVADLSPWALAGVTALFSTGLAALSYHLLERPLRHSSTLSRVPRVTIVAGLATSVVGALVLVPLVLS